MDRTIIQTDQLCSKSTSIGLEGKTFRVILIDSYPIVRTGIRFFLSQQRTDLCIFESSSIANFHAAHPADRPDIIILGLGHNWVHGCLDDLQCTRKWYHASSIIIYDDTLNMAMIRHYFKMGIMGYLSKQSHPDELNKCISSILTGLHYIGTDTLIQVNTPEEEKKVKEEKSNRLTQREQLIALYLVEGCKTSYIADKVGRKPSTISTTKSTIMRKMNVDNVVKLKIALSMQQGDDLTSDMPDTSFSLSNSLTC
jgi:DNA-binding NarL/FixJ family response regulator